jgi:hypothetical protein
MHHILIGTDSRGAYFKDFLSQHNLFSNDWEIHIDVAPGGTIKTISEKLLIKVKTLPVAINTQIVITPRSTALNVSTLTIITTEAVLHFQCT